VEEVINATVKAKASEPCSFMVRNQKSVFRGTNPAPLARLIVRRSAAHGLQAVPSACVPARLRGAGGFRACR
jgi:hypothetical protein